MEVEGVMVMLQRSVLLEKKHRKFLSFLRSRPQDFNFSRFVRKCLEDKMEEMDWEYQEEDEEQVKSDAEKWREEKQY